MVDVVYLFGTGVAEAERTYSGWNRGFLTSHVTDFIVSELKKEEGEDKDFYKQFADELMLGSEDVSDATAHSDSVRGAIDIEHYITLFESMDQEIYKNAAAKLKQLFFEYFKEYLFQDGVMLKPYLTRVLLQMHKIPENGEKLKAILTLNYEDLTDVALKSVWDNVDYLIETTNNNNNANTPPLLKIHGSFNWKNEFPIKIVEQFQTLAPEESIWIPPGVFKNKDRYPFNILWGRSKELLKCDILRIVGCSLNRNDWGLLELLFHTQRMFNYKIEIIDLPKMGASIKKSYAFLQNARSITDLEDLIELKKLNEDVDIEKYWGDENNILESWLKMKIELIEARNIDIPDECQYIKEFLGEKAENLGEA